MMNISFPQNLARSKHLPDDTSEVAMALDFDTVQRIEMFQGVLMFDYVQ